MVHSPLNVNLVMESLQMIIVKAERRCLSTTLALLLVDIFDMLHEIPAVHGRPFILVL